MVDLVAQSALSDILPFSGQGATLVEQAPLFITSIIPHQRAEKALSAAIKKAYGHALPAIGRSNGKAALRMIWAGRGQYFLLGDVSADMSLSDHAALCDQSDGWVVMCLAGEHALDVLAKLCPLDLRDDRFKHGQTARTDLAHMMAVVTRVSGGIEIMVMRSFATTAANELKAAIVSVDGQAALV